MHWDLSRIQELVRTGYLVEIRHPSADLVLYNYTARTQYDGLWTPETIACRGLILDGNGQTVARPFPKFFNFSEYQGELPAEPFEVSEKLDGTLGILYFHAGHFQFATRGSFTSPQGRRATAMLNQRYAAVLGDLDPACTYLFEILYPENRVVVDYGGREALVLLGAIETASGQERAVDALGFPQPPRFTATGSPSALLAREGSNREGFVIRYPSGLRLKLKFAGYLRLHALLTGVTTRTIWEYLRDGRAFDDLLAGVPDEFYRWVAEQRAELEVAYGQIERQALAEFQDLGDRRVTARHFLAGRFPQILFAMLDGKDYSRLIWRQLRPERPVAYPHFGDRRHLLYNAL